MENQTIVKNHQFRLLIAVVFVVFIGLIGVYIIQAIKTKPETTGGLSTGVSQTPTAVAHPTKGQLLIKVSDGQAKHAMTDYLVFDINAVSEGLDISGYDLVVNFDDQAFELVQAESQLPEFQLFKFNTDNTIILTGAKRLNAQSNHILTGEKIVRLTFKPLKTGSYQFRILTGSDKEKTQFVDSQTEIFYPTVSDTSVEIY